MSATSNQPQTQQGDHAHPEPERIGILLVHGVGEQPRFSHLDDTLRKVVAALESDASVESLSIDVANTQDSHFGASTEQWRAEQDAPVRISVRGKDGRHQQFHFREVWWADLDEATTICNQVKFWIWGLAQWSERRFVESALPGSSKMRLARIKPAISTFRKMVIRLQLYGVASVFFLVLITLKLANYILDRIFGRNLASMDLLVQYVGDVKLYQQRATPGKGKLPDINEPPRVAIRRRAVRAVVAMSLDNYDRWYMFAHSLGTVVAWNALMDTGHCLPNFLGPEQWAACCRAGQASMPIGGPAREQDLSGDTQVMRPARPLWLNDDDVIYRDRLFAKLKGVLTYGSPLDKFGYLWPQIVSINKDEAVFPHGFRWINVHDPMDPISGALHLFDPQVAEQQSRQVARPENYAYAASPLLMISHIRYFRMVGDIGNSLACAATHWLRDGEFPVVAPGSGAWLSAGQARVRRVSMYLQWILAALLMGGLIGVVLSTLSIGYLSWLPKQWYVYIWLAPLFALSMSSLAGIVKRLMPK